MMRTLPICRVYKSVRGHTLVPILIILDKSM